MYRRTNKDRLSFEDFCLRLDSKLSSNNRWVIMEKLIPWDEMEDDYTAHYSENTDNSQSRQLSKSIVNNEEINKRFELILPMSKIVSIAAFDVKTYLESLIQKRKDSFDVA